MVFVSIWAIDFLQCLHLHPGFQRPLESVMNNLIIISIHSENIKMFVFKIVYVFRNYMSFVFNEGLQQDLKLLHYFSIMDGFYFMESFLKVHNQQELCSIDL